VRILLDTHIYVWWLANDRRLPVAADAIIMDSANEVFVSAASIWEVSIKSALGQIEVDPNELVESIQTCGFKELHISSRHAVETAKLPRHHRDPFDRLLVAQSLVEPAHLLTHDRQLTAYGETILFV
jgi:PIN domain nuclease of toxin-antitoxin system